MSAMLSKSKDLVTAPEEGQAGELGDSPARRLPPSPHSNKAGTTTPRTCFPGTEIVWEGGVRGLGLPHAAFPWAFWVRIIRRLLITSYLCITLKDLSLDVFTACTPMISFDFQVSSVHLWGRHPHLTGEGTEAWGGDCHVVIRGWAETRTQVSLGHLFNSNVSLQWDSKKGRFSPGLY